MDFDTCIHHVQFKLYVLYCRYEPTFLWLTKYKKFLVALLLLNSPETNPGPDDTVEGVVKGSGKIDKPASQFWVQILNQSSDPSP